MRNFIQTALNESYKKGGNAYQFVSGCARRAENFLESGWSVIINETTEIYEATGVEVYFLTYPMGDSKFTKYRAIEDRIISEINTLLRNEGIKDCTIIKSGNFFTTQKLIYFTVSRPEPSFTFSTILGKSTLWEAVQIVGQVLMMKGFYIVNVEMLKQGIVIYDAQQPQPSPTDIYELETLMTFLEREDVIDNIVEKAIESIQPPTTIFQKIESTTKKIIIAAIIILIVYLLIIYQKPIKMGIETIEEKVGKSKKKD